MYLVRKALEVLWCITTNMLGIEEKGIIQAANQILRGFTVYADICAIENEHAMETATFDVITRPRADEVTAEQEQLQSWKVSE